MRQWDDTDRMEVSLWPPAAVVLFDWLMSVDIEAIPITHRGQKQALMDLLTALEVTEAALATTEERDWAQERVARDMGW